MTRTIYIAQFSFGDYRLASVEVTKETEKQFQVNTKSKKELHGYVFVPRRLNKDAFNIFETLHSAQFWCLNALRRHLEKLMSETDKVQENMAALEAEMKEQEP